jgi:hypothetical protein
MSRIKLQKIMNTEGHEKAVEAAILSGLLPEQTTEAYLMDVVKRAIRRVRGKINIPGWEAWAARWLSGEDRTDESAKRIHDIAENITYHTDDTIERAAAWAAANVASAARCSRSKSAVVRVLTLKAAARAAKWAAAERKATWAAVAWAEVPTTAEPAEEPPCTASACEVEAQYHKLLEIVNLL